MSAPIVVFPVENLNLTASEKEVLKKLIEAAKAIAPIYQKQENSKYLGANFYPSNATREEILEVSRHNSEILSPYTIVERNGKNKLVAVPYHIKFKKDLEKVARLLRDAAKLTKKRRATFSKSFLNFM